MIKRITSLTLVPVLIVLFCGTSTYARVSSDDEVQPAENTTDRIRADKLANEQLRTAINKLVSDAKAGKIAPAPRPQIQQRNNLSKGTKIAIGVGIAVAVVAIIVVARADNGPTGPIRIF